MTETQPHTMGVIFDMDGVLVNSYQAHLESWRQMAANRGMEMFTVEQFAATFGRTSKAIIRELWGEGFSEAELLDMDEEKEADYRQIIRREFPAMDGAAELLADLHAGGFAMAIGSSGPPENVAAVLECLPNSRHIAGAVTGREVRHGKPDPEVFLLAAGKLALAPSRCAVVEDAPAGIEAARRAGMTAIAITGTVPRAALAARAHHIVDSLRELNADVIGRLIAMARD